MTFSLHRVSTECSSGDHDACTKLFYDDSSCFGSVKVCSCSGCTHEGDRRRRAERRERLNAALVEHDYPEYVLSGDLFSEK